MSIGPIEFSWPGIGAFVLGALASAFTWGKWYQALKAKQESLEREMTQVKDAAAATEQRNDETHTVIFAKLETCALQLNHMNGQSVEMAAEAKHTRQLLDSFVERYEKRCDTSDALTRDHIRELRRYNDHVEREGRGE